MLCYLGREGVYRNDRDPSLNPTYLKDRLDKKIKFSAAFQDFVHKVQTIPRYEKLKERNIEGIRKEKEKVSPKPQEPESFKVIHSIEFNSLRERHLQNLKETQKPTDPYDYYGEDHRDSLYCLQSQQKSLMVFVVNSDSAIQKSEYLFAFNHLEVGDLAAFESLGFPLKQTIRVGLTAAQRQAEFIDLWEPKTDKDKVKQAQSRDYKTLFRF